MINKVREYRQKRNLSQEQLAMKAGVNVNIIDILETDVNMDIDVEDGLKIARALEEDLRNIFIV